ncbi:MAG TPA: MDR/SDR family oxidoreductase, partial [Solirubrobacterales bacterium]|nr:MDR/SDR family oxidoreductase [Solirubrobacterales bacterium]
EVRIEVRAAGVNFRDVMIALGHVPDPEALIALGVAPMPVMFGIEAAGIVTEVGAEVSDLAPGDRVMGIARDAFAPLVVGERAMLHRLPEDWSFEQGAAMPSAFLTALHGLAYLANLEAGEKVLIHAGAGAVGMAAIGIAHQRGAEVFATASPSKWDALRELGVAEDHIASSRDTEFEEKFLAVTEGKGVDVVLNALTGEFVDASLAVLGGEGRFLEIGKTDIRDRAELAATHPGVTYIPFDLSEAGPERVNEMLRELTDLFERGELRHSPIRSWDMRQAPEAFRHLREGRNGGKVVLSAPRALDPERTVLITGATGGLGQLVARHLAETHRAGRLLLASRSGEEAEGAEELKEELEALGAETRIAACDVSDRGQVEQLLAGIDPEHPLGAVIHCAAVLDDATVQGASPEQVKRVFAPKAGGARHLHELTAGAELTHFVCFSGVAGLLGAPGQGAYAAANRYLDALAQTRAAEGLPATSIAWGLWQRETAMTGGMGRADMARMSRGGIAPLSDERGLALFDRALSSAEPLGAALALDRAGLRAKAKAGALHPLLAGIAPQGKTAASGGQGALGRRLREAPPEARARL